MKLLDLCAGIGGFSLAGHWLGWQTEAFCEIDKFCQKVLAKNFPGVPIYDDVYTFPSESFRGRIGILTSGFPCQPFSHAGKRKGTEDERHLFPKILEIVATVRPRWVVAENVRGLLSIESGQVFADVISSLEGEGYEVVTFCIPASAVGAPHRRDRLWIIAHSKSDGDSRIARTVSPTDELSQEERPKERFSEFEQSDSIRLRTTSHTNRFGERTGLGEIQETNGEISERHNDAEFGSPNSASGIITDTFGTQNDRIGRDSQRGRIGMGRAIETALENDGQTDSNGIVGRDSTSTNSAEQGLQIGGYEGFGQLQAETGERIHDRFELDDSEPFTDHWKRVEEIGRGDTTRRRIGGEEEISGDVGQLSWRTSWLEAATALCRVDDGVSRQLDRTNRLKALGNSIVPQIAFEIFKAIEQAES